MLSPAHEEAAPTGAENTRRSLLKHGGYTTMPERQKSIPLDLTRYTEGTRREVYDRVVAHLWEPLSPGDYVPSYTPDAGQLTVVYLHGRWLALYIDMEEPTDAPPDQRAVMSRIVADPDSRFGIHLQEV